MATDVRNGKKGAEGLRWGVFANFRVGVFLYIAGHRGQGGFL
jgi:hypothetical protein